MWIKNRPRIWKRGFFMKFIIHNCFKFYIHLFLPINMYFYMLRRHIILNFIIWITIALNLLLLFLQLLWLLTFRKILNLLILTIFKGNFLLLLFNVQRSWIISFLFPNYPYYFFTFTYLCWKISLRFYGCGKNFLDW